MVSFEETDYVHHLIKKSEFKIYEDVGHQFESMPVSLISDEIKRFF